jgi:membrane-associated protease RseP (regulator of RpoE activity)
MAKRIEEQTVQHLLALVSRYVQVDGYFIQRDEMNLRGQSGSTPSDWQNALAAELRQQGYLVKIREGGANVCHLNIYPASGRIPWTNILLFLATLVSVSVVPAWLMEGPRVFRDFALLAKWLPFSIPLLTILLFHEFGHYLAARHRDIRVSLPYFLPAPTVIGTFGAFIKSKSPFPTRRDLLEVGAAGPIAGFVVALIFLGWSLTNVEYRPSLPQEQAYALVEPIIVRVMSFLMQSGPGPANHNIFLQDNQMLFAAWVGMVVTMLNLLPVGQLDGGHIIYALFPRQHKRVSWLVFLLLVASGFVWSGWWLWAVLLFFVVKFRHPPTLNDDIPLPRINRVLGWSAILIFLLTFTPVPF